MSIYIDELRVWPHAKHPFLDGSCHLTADSLDELHAFAKRIGMERRWFQSRASVPHYDLTPSRRAAAQRAGAMFVSAREQAIRRIKARVEGVSL